MRRDRRTRRPKQYSRCRGFTLVEILVVLGVIGVMVGLIAVNVSRDAASLLEDDARKLAVLLQYARDEAVTRGRPLAWKADAAGYVFLRRERGKGWARLEDERADEVLVSRAWPAGVSLAHGRVAGAALPPGEPIVFSASGLNPPFVLILASGASRIALEGDAAGKVRIERVPGEPFEGTR